MGRKVITGILKDNARTWGGRCDIATTILARDWKGWNTYGKSAVIEYEDEND